jgi:hypothetical protein
VIQMLAENSGSWLETQLFAAQIHHAGLVASNISDPFFLILLNTPWKRCLSISLYSFWAPYWA